MGRDAIVLTSLRTFASPVGNSAISNTPSLLASPTFTNKWRKTSTLNLKDSILPLEEVGYRGRDVLLDSGGLVEHRARGRRDLGDVLYLAYVDLSLTGVVVTSCWADARVHIYLLSGTNYEHNGQQFHRRLTP